MENIKITISASGELGQLMMFLFGLFSSNLHSFAKKAEELDQMVTKMIFESYGVEKYHETHAASITYLLRALKNKAPHSQNPTLCLVDHTDKSFTTMVYQDHTNGLEVQTKDGRWIQVDNSSPSTFVVIAGDAFKVEYTYIYILSLNPY